MKSATSACSASRNFISRRTFSSSILSGRLPIARKIEDTFNIVRTVDYYTVGYYVSNETKYQEGRKYIFETGCVSYYAELDKIKQRLECSSWTEE